MSELRFKRDPHKKPSFRLQERDKEIIKLVYDHRFLDSEQIALLMNISQRVANRRLQGLFHHGFLDRPRNQVAYYILSKKKMIYALGNKGADILTENYNLDRGKIDWGKKNYEVKERHLNHSMMISNFRVILTLALRKKPKTKIISWIPEGEIKDSIEFDGKTFPINPDGFLSIEDGGDEIYFLIEADQSTMTNKRFLNKMKSYWKWFTAKGHKRKLAIPSFRVLTICKSEQRKENLRKISKLADDSQRGSQIFYFTSEKNFSIDNPGELLANIWQTPRDSSWHSILE